MPVYTGSSRRRSAERSVVSSTVINHPDSSIASPTTGIRRKRTVTKPPTVWLSRSESAAPRTSLASEIGTCAADPAGRAMSRSVDCALDAVVAGPDATVKKAPFRNPKKKPNRTTIPPGEPVGKLCRALTTAQGQRQRKPPKDPTGC